MAKLNIADVRNLEPRAQRYEVPEGSVSGLTVRVTPTGIKSFALYYRRRDDGVMRRLTLGRFGGEGGVSLHEARRRAGDALEAVRDGADPAGDRKRKRAAAATLKAAGGPATLADEVRGYLARARGRLRPKTLETYGTAADKFVAWVEAERVELPTDLTRAHLVEFAAYLAELPCHAPAAKGKRGAKAATGRRRSPQSVNRELRTIKTILNGLRKAGKVPQLDRDALTDCLAALRVDLEAPAYLSPKQIERLLAACERHDAETFSVTREEHAGRGEIGTTSRYQPIRSLVLFLLLTGCRRGEALALRWTDVELDATDHHDNVVGELRLPASITKTHRARVVRLEVCPTVRRMLAAMKLRAPGDRVFEGYTVGTIDAARRRLLRDYGAPEFTWQVLRSTCATYLTNAPGIFGSASAYLSARQLGHSVAVAERHYTGVVRVSREARTLEAAMRLGISAGSNSLSDGPGVAEVRSRDAGVARECRVMTCLQLLPRGGRGDARRRATQSHR